MEQETKTCPYCAETILKAAIKCKFCASDLTTPLIKEEKGALWLDHNVTLQKGLLGVQGKLDITSNEIIFTPQNLLGKLEEKILIPLKDIRSIKKEKMLFVVNNLLVFKMNSGIEYKFAVLQNRDEIILKIQKIKEMNTASNNM
ncbi:MAG: GRAM domain-containing protein [Bacteroidia bacterium]